MESPNNSAGQMLSFPRWPEIDSRDALGPLKGTELALQHRDLNGPHRIADLNLGLILQVQQPDMLSSPSLMPWCRTRKRHLVVICLHCVGRGGVLHILAPLTSALQE